ncbi:hypothetical protein J3P77_00635 [Pseudomonas sp. R1-18]
MRKFPVATLLACLTVSLSACAAEVHSDTAHTAAAEGVTRGVFASRTVSLDDAQGVCVLNYEGHPPLKLDMQWPCRFSEDQAHQLRIESFKQTPILMVERSEPMPPPSRNCKTDRQPVRLLNGKLEAAPVGRIATCGPAHWDQKAFTAMFDW